MKEKRWYCGFLSLMLLAMSLSGVGWAGRASANGGGSVMLQNVTALAANDSAELKAEILSYDTNNRVVETGFQIWLSSAGATPPASPANVPGTIDSDGYIYGYATGLADNTEYYFRPYAKTEDELFSYGDPTTVTTATLAAMNGQKWITRASGLSKITLENGTPAADIEWPDEVEFVFTDGSKKNSPVTWEDKENYDSIMEDGGQLSFEGNIVLPNGSTDVIHPSWNGHLYFAVTIVVKASNIVAVDEIAETTVPVGATLQQMTDKLPRNIDVDLANGKRRTVSLEWDSGSPAFVPDTPGMYTFTGTLTSDGELRNDDERKAVAIVHVVPYLWQLVGPAGFTAGEVTSVSFVFDNAGTPYVAFKESTGSLIHIMKFNGTDWTSVGGAGLSGGAGNSVSLAYDDMADKLYVAYSDGEMSGAVTVRVFDSGANQWIPVGTAGFSGNAAAEISLAADSNNNMLFVAYADGGQQGRVTVMSYDGSAWTVVGTPGFSVNQIRAVTLTALYGSVMLTYEDAAAPHAPYAWLKEVYQSAFNAQPQLTSASSYLAHAAGQYQKYAIFEDSQGVQYKEFYYGAWQNGPVTPFTDYPVHTLDIIEVKTGDYSYAPYLAYTDSADGDKVTVKRLQDGEWLAIGSTAFTAGAAQELKLRFANGMPYVAIKDGAQGGKLTVLRYAPVLLPIIQTTAAENVGTTTAVIGGNMTADGTPTATERGVVYSTSPNPALGGPGVHTKTDAAIGIGIYKLSLSDLSPGTTYYVRAYAINSRGSVYGNEVTFTTASVNTDNDSNTGASPGPGANTVATPVPTPTPMKPKSLNVTVSDGVNGAAQPADTAVTQRIGGSLDLKAKLFALDGKPIDVPEFTVKNGEAFELPNVPAGQYKMLLQVKAPSGETLVGTMATLTVAADGNVTIVAELIDPYGIITDSVTGKPVDGVKVTLHWMDTELNRSKGRTPHELIVLPVLPDFAPNQNKDPQFSRDGGQYGWMVFPDGDYYILAEKEGYEPYDSRNDSHEATFGEDSFIRDGNIHVGRTIVKYDFEIDPVLKSTGEHKPYMLGYPDGNFLPESGISRAEVAAILSRTMAQDDGKATEYAGFADVSSGHWAAKDIRTAFANGWMKGGTEGSFQPERKLTRAELAQILVRLPGWQTNGQAAATFTDTKSHWGAAAIENAAGTGWISGFPDGSFRPDQPITRQDTVRIFNKLLGRIPQKDGIAPYWPDVPATHENFADIMEASIAHRYALYETGTEVWLGH
ncbi:S-layer homology domain-containing protein [Paenibacillus cymbidii]|uniref:S-layer homology domain-containing protein n=1 Tax=Paenibacillus cymbidii TaxID=1639034 RepID=UPI001436A2D2|nr:S-layer homology domain-containing protein [Paenibacillus cymbidii]